MKTFFRSLTLSVLIFSLLSQSAFAAMVPPPSSRDNDEVEEEVMLTEEDSNDDYGLGDTELTDIWDYDYSASIQYLVDEKIVDGYDDYTFRPENSINRAEFTKILIEATYIGVDESYADDCFTDVSKDAWYSPYVCFAKSEGILAGNPDGSFGPSDPITQPAALKIIFNTLEYEVPETDGEWYQMYLDKAEYLAMYYFESDYSNTEGSAAQHELTRGEAAYFMAWILSEESIDKISEEQFYDDNLSAYISNWYLDEVGELDEDYTFGMSESDCQEQESYYEKHEICYLAYDQYYDDSWAWDDYDFDEDYEQEEWDFDEDGEPESMAIYSIDGSDITLESNISTTHTEEDFELLWDYFANTIPESDRQYITKVEFFTDGMGNTLAAVAPTYESNYIDWTLYIDVNDSLNEDGTIESIEFPLTVIHEYTHVLTLQNEQVPVSYWSSDASRVAEEALCDTLFLDEGCANEDSYIYQFYLNYWQEIDAYDDVFDYYFDGHENDFITEYAATSIAEDIAESFSYFVFYDKPASNSTVADEKILFFYEYDELVTLRTIIRSRLQSDSSETSQEA
jgi:hypothetical protein